MFSYVPLVILLLTPGYPPADHDSRDYLTADLPQGEVYNRMCAFSQALFEHTADTIRNFDDSECNDLAATFRRKMTEGQTYTSVNDFRKDFYAAVIRKAKACEGKVRNRFAFCYVILNLV